MQEKAFHDEDAQRLGRLPEMQKAEDAKAEDVCGGGGLYEEEGDLSSPGSWRTWIQTLYVEDMFQFFHQIVE